jgi:hypothetical protein
MNPIDRAFYLRTETEPSLGNFVLIKTWPVDDVQKTGHCSMVAVF